MKHEWRKQEKNIYFPKNKPELINVPAYNYFTIEGEGDPNGDSFGNYIAVLYSFAYAVKMSPKKGLAPDGYFDYTIYPLEGLWDINDAAKENFNGTFNKNDLVFNLMIRQPDFVHADFAHQIITDTKLKRPDILYDKVKFETITEGYCIQMLHLGSYDDEPASFKLMKEFSDVYNYKRLSMVHKEIYLTDARKTPPEKLKTVLRFRVKQKTNFWKMM